MAPPTSSPSTRPRRAPRTWLLFGVPVVVILAAGFAVAYFFVKPAPPRELTLATGPEDGAYHRFGQRFRTILARSGITVRLRSTKGSVENLELLRAQPGEVQVAFLQGGVVSDARKAPGDEEVESDVVGLASLYREPIWIFCRGEPPQLLRDLGGRRIAIGPEGSGTRAVALRLLRDTGIAGDAQLLPLGADEAARALSGPGAQVDAAMIIGAPTLPAVRSLLEMPGVSLMDLRRAPAHVRVHPYFTELTLPEGTLDLAKDLPPHDVRMIAVTAMLAARPDLHPALSDLLLQAAREIHGGGGVLEDPGEFPSARNLDLPLSRDAQRFHTTGLPFLYRYLPFWAATLVDRMKVLLIPLITLLIPLIRLVPPIYQWHIRSKIYRWYADLRSIEDRARSEPPGRLLADLAVIEEEVAQVEVPLSYASDLYHVRLHIGHVRRSLSGEGAGEGGRDGGAGPKPG